MVSHATRKRLSGPGLRTFGRICDRWQFTERERRLVLGMPSRKTYRLWLRRIQGQESITLDQATLVRISAVLAVHGALAVLNVNAPDEAEWLRRMNFEPPFEGRSPTDFLLSGNPEVLLAVVRHLKAKAAGMYSQPYIWDGAPGPIYLDKGTSSQTYMNIIKLYISVIY